jgi:predicted nucleotidyltransferase
MSPTPYPELDDVLREFHSRLVAVLCDDLVGIYLHGSLAIGDFDEAESDVDFVVVINRELTDAQSTELKVLHADILALPSHFAKRLEGSYFPRALLNNSDTVGKNTLWFLNGGTRTMGQAVYDNSWVVLWELHNLGIAVVGPDPKTLFSPVPAAILRREVLSEMKGWRNTLVLNPDSINCSWNQSFVVLTYCRMLNTLESGAIHSKLASVRWSKLALPERWHSLIRRAWNKRKDLHQAGRQPAETSEVIETLAFTAYAIGMGDNIELKSTACS